MTKMKNQLDSAEILRPSDPNPLEGELRLQPMGNPAETPGFSVVASAVWGPRISNGEAALRSQVPLHLQTAAIWGVLPADAPRFDE